MSDTGRKSHHETTAFAGAAEQAFPSATRKAWKSPKVIIGTMAAARGVTISGTQPSDGIVFYAS